MTKAWKCFGAFLLSVVLWFVWSTYHFFEYGIDNAYAQWGAAEMVISFMKENDGRWPKGWEDLRPAFDAGKSRVGGWTFEKFQNRIWIDWNADPNALEAAARQSGSPTFHVVAPLDGIDVEWQGKNGDQILYEHFRSRAVKTPSPQRGQ
jgi:hypothetical protein